jgi:cyclopropane fatty-acyl-phospholipid synthase-like methyltransferase
MMKQTRDILRETYNHHAQEREKNEMREWKVKPRNEFLNLIKSEGKSSLLEIGAGHGRDSRFFMDSNLKVMATDLSPEMIKLCKQKGIEAYEIDFYSISEIKRKFDAVWAMNCLLHVEKENLPFVLHQIDQVLEPYGLLFIGVYGGVDWEGIWEEDFYSPHRFFSFYTDEGIKAVVLKYFDIVQFERIDFGGKHHFQSIMLRKRSK